ncbi:hypothetical protein Poli38472_006454 [Pythium oligandrum]|uniref:Uncharacterized protein n=1 Tax=Pythium oligandrum TaxID=41045 RepID=A0A8K1FD33_PYTOL|nr:hypothetical protein Poli38472_006454 [Pythium oligandrum]|eukprot:TMW56444.1 hypothetical protein Poli38472_006454 [Pythium oligandrum]
MERALIHEYELYISSSREDIRDLQHHLETTQQEIKTAEDNIQDLTIEACTLRVRMKELELDEEAVKKAEEDAIMDKIVSQKRLVEIGGHESAVRRLQKALKDAKRELDATKEETKHVMSEEIKLHQELINLNRILQRSQQNSGRLQEEYAGVMREKRETDSKLQQLCMFLQTDAPPSAPTSPSVASTTASSPLSTGSTSSMLTS